MDLLQVLPVGIHCQFFYQVLEDHLPNRAMGVAPKAKIGSCFARAIRLNYTRKRGSGLHQTEQEVGTQQEPTRGLLVDRSLELESLVLHDLAKFRSKAYQQLRNSHDAEDAVQDALVSAFEHLAEFEGRSLLSTWLTTIVVNAARLHVRRRLVKAPIDQQLGSENLPTALEETIADERPGPDEILARMELYRLMAELIKGLSPVLRKTIRHYYVDGMTAAEVAGMLDVPVGTVKARIWRARARLRQALNARRCTLLGRNPAV